MRRSFLPTLLVACSLAVPALAAEPAKPPKAPVKRICVNVKDGSKAVQGTNLVVEPGDTLRDAVAVDGDVIVKKGAVVDNDVAAIRGRVILEAGARVKGDVVSLGGEVRVHSGARVDGSATALGGKLKLDKQEDVGGEKVSFSMEFNGEDLVKQLIGKALDEDQKCHILDDDDDDTDA
ncbi:polymer-forming cytoskeletal protein [Corallococcus sp. ZKHCc1 1396]|uniref:Polymer-forming cytoskeletal protein n=1 Tax=Corallococcus soli TaxID=2710757 RepID=A0ABR9PN89_9BACT|nr:polymer-forming cytoskeletal protein [Corallococcus soli]MBE4749381.1 polymer-forming cytoskeletal protein [Corallococcus soli]